MFDWVLYLFILELFSGSKNKDKTLNFTAYGLCVSVILRIFFKVLTVQCVEIEHILLGGCGWVMSEALEYHATHHERKLFIHIVNNQLI